VALQNKSFNFISVYSDILMNLLFIQQQN